MAADGDPRRILADVRALAHRVRVDQRMTWAALLVLGGMTLLAIPFDWFGMRVDCGPDGGCTFARNGMLYYWPAAMLIGYGIIAVCYLRAARSRGLGARVLPYAITGAVTTLVFPAAWLAVHLYFQSHPYPAGPLPFWYLVLDRLVMPWGMIGVALLVLAWLERNLALLLFTTGYLALVLLLLPMNDGLDTFGIRASMALPQVVAGIVLLLGAAGFARSRR
ncbi:hypothetical protein ACTI_73160 [Actinoplanes sp. OR16]|nr:hypothetical protein ACTI_73160 [Actinoplanes sp. OR16]